MDEELSSLISTSKNFDSTPTTAFQRVIQRAAIHVQSSGRSEVTGANVLVAIFAERESNAAYFLQEQEMTRYDAVNFIAHGVAKNPAYSEKRSITGSDESEGKIENQEKNDEAPETALQKYCIDLNAKALEGDLDPLIGRNAEVERCIQILCRRRKNNPLLVGDPGVGKTAIAEGLAKLIIEGSVPDAIASCVVYSLDLGSLLAGTKYRGDFEKRFKAVLKQLKEEIEDTYIEKKIRQPIYLFVID